MDDLTATWVGRSGTAHSFTLFPLGAEFLPYSGVYVFCRRFLVLPWEALYVGETKSFYDRLNAGSSSHRGMKDAIAAGATHVGLRWIIDESERLRVETDLRHGLNPVCNRQNISALGLGLGSPFKR